MQLAIFVVALALCLIALRSVPSNRSSPPPLKPLHTSWSTRPMPSLSRVSPWQYSTASRQAWSSWRDSMRSAYYDSPWQVGMSSLPAYGQREGRVQSPPEGLHWNYRVPSLQYAPVAVTSLQQRFPARIHGGSTAPDAVNRRSVKVQLNAPSNGRSRFCSGSVVRRDTVLTAAHCFDPISGGVVTEAIITGARGTYGITAQIYKGYAQGTTEAEKTGRDFALIETADEFGSTNLFRLSTNNAGYFTQGHPMTIAGWGLTNPSNRPTSIQEATLFYEDSRTCPTAFQNAGAFCTKPVANGPLTCDGDSGGPVFDDSGYVQIGIHSGANGATGCPGTGVTLEYHVDVSRYYTIINKCMNEFDCSDFNEKELDSPL